MQRKEVIELHVEGGEPIYNLHGTVLDGACNVPRAHRQEVVCFGQGEV